MIPEGVNSATTQKPPNRMQELINDLIYLLKAEARPKRGNKCLPVLVG